MNNSLQWDDLRYFLALCQHGSLVAAAAALQSSQPTVGRRIRALERATGQKLVQQHAGGWRLTEQGQQVHLYASRMAEDSQALQRAVQGQQHQLSGTVRLSASDWFGELVLAPLLARFSQLYPAVQLELLTDSRPLDLAKGEADLAFRIIPFHGADIAQRPLLQLHYGLYSANPDLQLQKPGHGLALISLDPQFSQLPDALWLREQFPAARLVFRSNSRQAQAAFCAASQAVAVLPVALAAAWPALHLLDYGEPPPGRQVWLGYHRDLRQQTRLRLLIDFLLAELAGDPRFGGAML